MDRNCGALCNIVVISMRPCDREKSEALVHDALKEFPAGIGLWYMGGHALTVLLSPCTGKRFSVQKGAASHVVGSWMSLPDSQTC